MPVGRSRLRRWIEKQIESGSVPGVIWLNKDEKIFQIPWKHGAPHGWDIEKDASLFQSWAIHTGKYKVGEKKPDPKTWKANFRHAMNSLPDIKKLKDRSICKGSSAVRVYQMLEAPVKAEKKDRKSKSQRDSKSRPKKKFESSPIDEVEEAVKNCPLPEDHDGYTVSSYSTEISVGSSDLARNQCDVSSSISPWSNEIERPMPDSTNTTYDSQVSPMPSSSEDDKVPEEIFRFLEKFNESGTQNSFINDQSFMDLTLREIEVCVTKDIKHTDCSWQELDISCLSTNPMKKQQT